MLPTSDAGAAFVYEGDSLGMVPPVARQRRGDGSGTPIAIGGAAFASDRFAIDFYAGRFIGQERVKLEVVVCDSGLPLAHLTCTSHVSPSWVAVPPAGLVLTQMITGLAPDPAYSWRARALYTPTLDGDPPPTLAGPWYRLQGRADYLDIRTVPEPGVGLGVMVGALFLARVHRTIRWTQRST